jgi:hypothetical protein
MESILVWSTLGVHQKTAMRGKVGWHVLSYNTAFLAILDVNFERLEVGEIIELGNVW